MPKIDPVTGCTVMTMPEFLNDMAEKEGEGRTGGDILGDVIEEMGENDRENEKHIAEDTATILKQMQEWVSEDEYTDAEYPVEILEVVDVKLNSNFSGSTTLIRSKVKCKDGSERACVFTESYWMGTRLDPPEYDAELSWE